MVFYQRTNTYLAVLTLIVLILGCRITDYIIKDVYKRQEFEVQTIEFEMLTQYFEKPTEEEEALFFMTTAQVLA